MSAPPQLANGPGGCRRLVAPLAVLGGLILVAGLGLSIYVWANLQSISANFVARTLIQGVNQSATPDDQKKQMIQTITNVRDRYAAGDLSDQQIKRVSRAVFNNPSINAGLFYFAAKQAVDDSSLEREEQDRVTGLLRRFAHGVDRGRIDSELVAELAPLVSDQGQPKDDIPQADIQTLIERVEAEVGQIDQSLASKKVPLAKWFDQAVTRALQRKDAGDGKDQDHGNR